MLTTLCFPTEAHEGPRRLLTAGLLSSLFAMPGCGKNYDPAYWHELYVENLQAELGLKRARQRGPIWDKYLIERVTLPNGNVLYKYNSGGTCRDILEVDPKADIIVGVSWEGDAKHCIVTP